MLAIVDYGVGNVFSLCRSLEAVGQTPQLTGDPALLAQADRLILPGVGAFRDAAAQLRKTGLWEVVCRRAAAGVPLLGICLGMQLLFSRSEEFGNWEGLGLIPGAVVPFAGQLPPTLKIPHMGWNQLQFPADRPRHPLFAALEEGDAVYFVHSFHAVDCDADVIARTEYGVPVTAAVARGNVMGCQFHPEKSGNTGLRILRAFCEEGALC